MLFLKIPVAWYCLGPREVHTAFGNGMEFCSYEILAALQGRVWFTKILKNWKCHTQDIKWWFHYLKEARLRVSFYWIYLSIFLYPVRAWESGALLCLQGLYSAWVWIIQGDFKACTHHTHTCACTVGKYI